MSEVVALDTLDAVAVVVNLGARGNTASHAVAIDQVVKRLHVARHAVEHVWSPEQTT